MSIMLIQIGRLSALLPKAAIERITIYAVFQVYVPFSQQSEFEYQGAYL